MIELRLAFKIRRGSPTLSVPMWWRLVFTVLSFVYLGVMVVLFQTGLPALIPALLAIAGALFRETITWSPARRSFECKNGFLFSWYTRRYPVEQVSHLLLDCGCGGKDAQKQTNTKTHRILSLSLILKTGQTILLEKHTRKKNDSLLRATEAFSKVSGVAMHHCAHINP